MKSEHKKLLIAPLLLLSVIILSACSVSKPAATENNENTAAQTNAVSDMKSGVKLYKNEQYGFSFNYPASWYISPCGSTNLLILITDDEKLKCENGPFDHSGARIISVEEDANPEAIEIEKELLNNYRYIEKNIVSNGVGLIQLDGVIDDRTPEGGLTGDHNRVLYSYIPFKSHYLVVSTSNFIPKKGDLSKEISNVKEYNEIVGTLMLYK